MAQNKIVTSVSALTDETLTPTENVVCIDTRNSRIGVKKSQPLYEIDVSGQINTNSLTINNNSTILNSLGIITNNLTTSTLTTDSLTSSNTINIGLNSISSAGINFINSSVKCNDISCIFIKCISGNFTNSLITNLSATNLSATDLSSTNLYVQNIKPLLSSQAITIDGSLNVNNVLLVKNINPLVGRRDISINANVWIDGSLNILGNNLTSGSTTVTSFNVTTSYINLMSDDRLKHNEENIKNALLTIRKLNPQIYQKTTNFKNIHYRGPLTESYIVEAGLIAQDVAEIDELKFSVINGNEKTPYYINYNNIFIYCLAAVKELDTNLENLKNLLNVKNQTNNSSNNNESSNNESSNNESSNNESSNNESSNNESSNNESSNYDLINIINNQNIQMQELINKISILENRISIIESAF
jgi:hypothetical protein